MNKYKKLLPIVLFIGTVFAFYTVYNDFLRFYSYEGTYFKVRDCAVPNPVTTPCFYGAFAFLSAFIWSIIDQKIRYLSYFLIGGAIFAWSSFGYELYSYFNAGGESYIGCSGIEISNPFTTPCFQGAVLFLISMIVGLMRVKEAELPIEKGKL